jgi:predicted transcriptional regulator
MAEKNRKPKKKKKRKKLVQLKTVIHNALVFNHLKYMSEAEVKVYWVIAMHANWHTGASCPTHERIMELAGIKHHSTVTNAVERLAEKRLLTYKFRRPRRKDGTEYGRPRYFYSITHPAKSDYLEFH